MHILFELNNFILKSIQNAYVTQLKKKPSLESTLGGKKKKKQRNKEKKRKKRDKYKLEETKF